MRSVLNFKPATVDSFPDVLFCLQPFGTYCAETEKKFHPKWFFAEHGRPPRETNFRRGFLRARVKYTNKSFWSLRTETIDLPLSRFETIPRYATRPSVRLFVNNGAEHFKPPELCASLSVYISGVNEKCVYKLSRRKSRAEKNEKRQRGTESRYSIVINN